MHYCREQRMRIPTFILGLALCGTCLADTVRLKNGQVLEGNVKHSDSGYVVILPDGKQVQVKASEIDSIKIGGSSSTGTPSEEVSKSRLNSLRKSMETVNTPAQAIERYKQFIEQNTGSTALDDAKQDLATWEDRQTRGLVRIGTEWVTPDERAKRQQQAMVDVVQVRQLMRDGKFKDARQLVDKILVVDAENVSALYLRGLMQYQSNQVVDARKSFESAHTLLENHAPTLNNLAVIATRQNAIPTAMDYYDKAMIASPQDVNILNNVAEALHAIPKDKQNTGAVQRAYKRFVAQDQQLQQKMAGEHQYRWGSSYIPLSEYDRIQQMTAQVQSQLDAMAGEFQSVQDRIKKLDIEGEANDRALRQIEASSWYRDPDGNLIRIPYPPVYAELQRDNDKLKADRRDAVARLEQLRVQADGLRSQLPAPKYTGVQTLIGVEGTPAILPVIKVGPSTTPSPAPATDPALADPKPAEDPATQPAASPSATQPSMNSPLPPTPAFIPPASQTVPHPLATQPAMEPPATQPAALPMVDPPASQPATMPSTATQPVSATQPVTPPSSMALAAKAPAAI